MQPEIAEKSPDIAAASADRRRGFKATAASIAGFTLDFYDLYVVVFVAPVIASAFFPADQRTLSLAGAYATLAVTLVMRPIGAAVLGAVADRHGRRRAMVIGLAGVGLVTASMGALPTAAQAGVLAPILLLTLRMAQGLFVGGVFASTLTLGAESVSPRWRGVVSGLVGGGGTAAGSVLASLALVASTRVFEGDAFSVWGWRVMFFAGALPVLLSLIVARYVDESPLWRPQRADRRPLRELWTPPNRRALLQNVAVVFGVGTHFLLTLGFLPTYLQEVNGLSAAQVGPLLVAVNLAAILFAPLAGHWSQRAGRRAVLLTMAAVNVVVLPLAYWWLSALGPGSLPLIAVGALVVSCLTVACFGPLPIFLAERFTTPVRGSGTALSINLGFALAGLVPAAVNALSSDVGALTGYVVTGLVLAGVVAVTVLSRIPEPTRSLD
ncbi:MFS transporter [Actinoplanes sp. NPDC051346]|uniref:MFS transporter n=1 Tax=Actinoplanes sp. NPDC051346 TaxID=3155048 RepID=UPI00342D146E